MTSLSKTNIKEANEHLKQLHQRIYDLETQLQLHVLNIQDLQKSNVELKRQLAEEKTEKEQLQKKMRSKDELLESLLSSAEEKDQTMIKMENKSRLFHELVDHKDALEHILHVLDEVSRSCDQSCDHVPNHESPDVSLNGFNNVKN